MSDDGAPIFIARSITWQIFGAYAPESEPPITVKSCPPASARRFMASRQASAGGLGVVGAAMPAP
ncbi:MULTISPECIES: hypothetical protein [Sorangium]|uniref:Uncharacterized protein n=1 Tax=Sorangium atrum TaxID=2995308 RepID=A0ABT5CE41_9BACT|nr:hypothetical protein [Sorangium aterium]MDC0684703.1 hypothetical protein [Sorangium aterium]